MPQHVKWITRCGNGLLISLLVLMALFGDDLDIALFLVPVIALLSYNIYVIERCARLLG